MSLVCFANCFILAGGAVVFRWFWDTWLRWLCCFFLEFRFVALR